MNRNILNSPRLLELKKARRRGFINKIFVCFLGLVIVFACLMYLSRLPYFQIKEIKISGNKVVDTELIKKVADQEISGNYLWFFPRKNILLYPKSEIRNTLASQFTRLGNIEFSLSTDRTLEISVTERVPIYTWCGATPLISSTDDSNNFITSKCYFIDESGYIFDEAPYFSGEVYFKFYGKTPLNNGVPSSFYFSPKNFNELISFKNNVIAMGLKPASFYLEDTDDIVLYLSGSSGVFGPEIIFKTDADLEQVVENLQTAITTEPLKSEIETKYSSLLYIDLRYGNKVFYKFK